MFWTLAITHPAGVASVPADVDKVENDVKKEKKRVDKSYFIFFKWHSPVRSYIIHQI